MGTTTEGEVNRNHWPDCAVNHGGSECDMGPECGDDNICETDMFSSRACEKGTRGCVTKHKYGVHEKTGHETAIPKDPERWGHTPREVVVELKPANFVTDPGMWFAWIHPKDYVCKCPTPDPVEQSTDPCVCLFDVGWLTHGDSPANALYMAYDLMSTYWVECSADKEGGVAHCWCQDTVDSPPWEDPPSNPRWIKCCRCDHHAALSEFVDA